MLSSAQREAQRARFARDLSDRRTPLPLTKPQLRALVDAVDDALDVAEQSIVGRVPAGHPARDWIVAHAGEVRRLIGSVALTRAEES